MYQNCYNQLPKKGKRARNKNNCAAKNNSLPCSLLLETGLPSGGLQSGMFRLALVRVAQQFVNPGAVVPGVTFADLILWKLVTVGVSLKQ